MQALTVTIRVTCATSPTKICLGGFYRSGVYDSVCETLHWNALNSWFGALANMVSCPSHPLVEQTGMICVRCFVIPWLLLNIRYDARDPRLSLSSADGYTYDVKVNACEGTKSATVQAAFCSTSWCSTDYGEIVYATLTMSDVDGGQTKHEVMCRWTTIVR